MRPVDRRQNRAKFRSCSYPSRASAVVPGGIQAADNASAKKGSVTEARVVGDVSGVLETKRDLVRMFAVTPSVLCDC
jgi:hypothetical protein